MTSNVKETECVHHAAIMRLVILAQHVDLKKKPYTSELEVIRDCLKQLSDAADKLGMTFEKVNKESKWQASPHGPSGRE